tara:strand:+ start:586 stop:744 length:159 start_codon:yes stop_codon:yes gene_type:complete
LSESIPTKKIRIEATLKNMKLFNDEVIITLIIKKPPIKIGDLLVLPKLLCSE